MRRPLVTLTGVAVAAFGLTSSAPAAPAEAAFPGPLVRPVAADVKRARSVPLRAADVFAEFTRTTASGPLPTVAHCNGYPGDRSDITVTGEGRSAFAFGSHSIGSSVLWFESVADAKRYWARTVRLQYIECRAKGLRLKNGAGAIVEPAISQAAAIALRPTGADAAAAYRVIGGVPGTPGAGNDSYNYLDTNVFVRVGRSIALLRTVWITSACDCYHRLARVLATRLRAAR